MNTLIIIDEVVHIKQGHWFSLSWNNSPKWCCLKNLLIRSFCLNSLLCQVHLIQEWSLQLLQYFFFQLSFLSLSLFQPSPPVLLAFGHWLCPAEDAWSRCWEQFLLFGYSAWKYTKWILLRNLFYENDRTRDLNAIMHYLHIPVI